jgi:hypothetical protein
MNLIYVMEQIPMFSCRLFLGPLIQRLGGALLHRGFVLEFFDVVLQDGDPGLEFPKSILRYDECYP